MEQLFVHELFSLLRQFGITQEVVAQHLGIAHSSVRSWSRGQRAIPVRHAEPFLAFVRTSLATALAEAWASNQEPTVEDAELQDRLSTALEFEADVLEQLRRWHAELFTTTRRLQEAYTRHQSTLRLYAHLSPRKLSREEQRIVHLAANGLSQTMRLLALLRHDPAGAETRVPGVPADRRPLDYFDELVESWRATQGDDAQGMEEESD